MFGLLLTCGKVTNGRQWVKSRAVLTENLPTVSAYLPTVSENLLTHVWQAAIYSTRQTRACCTLLLYILALFQFFLHFVY